MTKELTSRIRKHSNDEKIHDRRAKDTLAAGDYAAIDVPDPYGEPGEKVTVLRQLRGDPLARLHAHKQITDTQFLAGRRYQRDWELAEQGSQAIDTTKEKVDGGKPAEPLPVSRMQASDRLKAAHDTLGVNAKKLVYAFLIQEQNIERLAVAEFRRAGDRWANYYGRMLRDALDMLAVEYGLATPDRSLPVRQISR